MLMSCPHMWAAFYCSHAMSQSQQNMFALSSGEWGSGDDRRLLRALAKTGATHDFQVDWGQLVASRTAMQTRRRWRLMLKCVKDAADREFYENLRTLLETFTPDLLGVADTQKEDHDPEAVDDLS